VHNVGNQTEMEEPAATRWQQVGKFWWAMWKCNSSGALQGINNDRKS